MIFLFLVFGSFRSLHTDVRRIVGVDAQDAGLDVALSDYA